MILESPVSTLSTPPGTPARRASSASANAVSGVDSAGFRITCVGFMIQDLGQRVCSCKGAHDAGLTYCECRVDTRANRSLWRWFDTGIRHQQQEAQ